jgi:hypothetical protein
LGLYKSWKNLTSSSLVLGDFQTFLMSDGINTKSAILPVEINLSSSSSGPSSPKAASLGLFLSTALTSASPITDPGAPAGVYISG